MKRECSRVNADEKTQLDKDEDHIIWVPGTKKQWRWWWVSNGYGCKVVWLLHKHWGTGERKHSRINTTKEKAILSGYPVQRSSEDDCELPLRIAKATLSGHPVQSSENDHELPLRIIPKWFRSIIDVLLSERKHSRLNRLSVGCRYKILTAPNHRNSRQIDKLWDLITPRWYYKGIQNVGKII